MIHECNQTLSSQQIHLVNVKNRQRWIIVFVNKNQNDNRIR